MWIFSKAVQKSKPLCVAPQAYLEDPIGGYSWWNLVHAADSESPSPSTTSYRDLSEPISRLEHFIESLADLYQADLDQLYAVGFSQGAAMISTLSLRRPDLFRGVALLSGFVPRIVLEEAKAQQPLYLPDYFIAHGTEDKVVTIQKAEQARDTLESLGAQVTFHSDKVAHKMGASGIRALTEWFSSRIPIE
jgi:phospholipase/carboxylesterase